MGLFSIVKSCKHENVNFADLGKIFIIGEI